MAKMREHQATHGLARTEWCGCISLVLCVLCVFLSGCQGTLGNVQGRAIQYSDRIVLQDGKQQSGEFRTNDLTVNYEYTRNGDSLQISGVIQLNYTMQSLFLTIRTFNLVLLLADNQGRITAEQGLTMASGASVRAPINFDKTIVLPSQTALMAFSYTGQVTGSGSDGSPSSFWHDPVTR
jgi:hypothetical protein